MVINYVGIFMPFNTYFQTSITYFFFGDFTRESNAIPYRWPNTSESYETPDSKTDPPQKA